MIAISCVLPFALLIAQLPQPEGESRPAVVSGRVVDAGNGRPIAGVIVTPAGTASNPTLAPNQVSRLPARVMTNASGQFVFRGLRKGSLVLTATKGGYANATHGQRRPGGSAQPLAVNEGDRLADIEIRMWKHASITGTVVDEAGDPVVGGRVQSFQRGFSGGRRRYSQTGSTTTDDRGIYRISGLTPGDYIIAIPQMQAALPADVSDALLNGNPNDPKRTVLMRETIAVGGMLIAQPGSPYSMKIGEQTISLPTGTVSPFTAPNNALMIYPTAFYPAGALPTQAALITVRSGEERGGIDLQVRPSRSRWRKVPMHRRTPVAGSCFVPHKSNPTADGPGDLLADGDQLSVGGRWSVSAHGWCSRGRRSPRAARKPNRGNIRLLQQADDVRGTEPAV